MVNLGAISNFKHLSKPEAIEGAFDKYQENTEAWETRGETFVIFLIQNRDKTYKLKEIEEKAKYKKFIQ